MNKDILDIGIAAYNHAVGWDDLARDDDGFVVLKPTAARIDKKSASLTTNISDLEAKLKKFKAEKAQVDKAKKSEEYKESKKRMSKKKAKKKRDNLLEMVFNNADAELNADDDEDEDSEEGGEYRDSKKAKPKVKKDTLDSTYGKRFSPVVSMLHDTIVEFDAIAADIEDELKSARAQAKSMYRSSQIGNLISAKNSKLSAVKELASVAKTVSDLEYKKEKDKKAEEAGDSNKAISNIGAKYLRGSDIFGDSKKKKSKDKDKDKGKSKSKTPKWDDDDDDVDDSIKKQRSDDQRALAAEFAKTISTKKGDIELSPHERFVSLEGKYSIAIIASITDEKDWRFVALDKKGKEIKNFKDDYPGLLPKKSKCRMQFDFSRLKATDKNSSRQYRLLVKD